MILKKKKKFNFKTPKNLYEKIKTYFSFLFLTQIIIIIAFFLWYFNSYAHKVHSPDKIFNIISQNVKNLTGFELNKIDEYIKIYSLGVYYNIVGVNLETLELNINQKGLIELDFQRQSRGKIDQLDEKNKKRLKRLVNGSLIYNDENFPVKLRVKGERPIHFEDLNSTSYKMDIRGGKKLLGLEEFSIQKPIARNYIYEYIFHKLNHELGNISLDYKVVNFVINGTDRGVFTIEEGFSKELIERNGLRNGPIFGINDRAGQQFPNIIFDSYSELNWLTNNPQLLKTGYSVLNSIKYNTEDYEKFIDWESWAKFFAVTDLVETYHGALAKSVRFYYNPVIGKIQPISFDGHHGTADFSDFIILDFINKDSNCSWICNERDWFLRFLFKEENILRNKFVNYYLHYLEKITDEKFLNKFLIKYGNEINLYNKAFYSDFSKTDQMFWKGWVPYVYDKKYLIKRSKKIREKLDKINFSNFYFSKKKNKLVIDSTASRMPINIKPTCSFVSNNLKKIWVIGKTSLDWPNNCDEIQLMSISGKTKNVYLFENPIMVKKYLPVNFNSFEKFHNKVNGYFLGNEFYPSEKDMIISENVVLPKNLKLILKNNQKIYLRNSALLIFLGDVIIKGNENNFVSIIGQEPEFGTVLSFNNKFDSDGLLIKNLKAPFINGYDFYGGINFVKSEISLKNTILENSKSEDSLNLINSAAKLKNVKFKNTQSDALDIDSGNIEFENISCINIGNDCIDFSNSIVKGNIFFAEKIGDKSLSIGENSQVNINNLNIINSEIGVAVKDNSIAVLENINLSNTTLPVAVFVKKKEYGPAKLEIKNFNLNQSNEILLVDKFSELIINGKIIQGDLKGEEVEALLYGNVYGKKTTR